jgi:hypothetical protein
MPRTAVKANHLSKTQQQEVVEMFNAGIKQYTEIAKKLKLKYVAVNKFMTQWKAEHGMLQRRNTQAKQAREANKARSEGQVSTASPKEIPDSVIRELNFLRDFYIQARKEI